jgi:hypothetical protein
MAKYYSPQGNIEVWEDKPEGYYTVEEWAELHPTPEPPEPTKKEKLAALDSQYEADKAEIMKYYVDSVIHMDVDLTNELADEMILLDRQYKKDREEIEKE